MNSLNFKDFGLWNEKKDQYILVNLKLKYDNMKTHRAARYPEGELKNISKE